MSDTTTTDGPPPGTVPEDWLFFAEGLSALLADRTRSFKFAADVALSRGTERPRESDWGIPQIQTLMRRMGVAPTPELPGHVPNAPAD